MSGVVLTMAQQKGGAGKTTLAAHLAIHWAGKGKRVALVDIDPQGSLKSWVTLRESLAAEALAPFTFGAISGWRVQGEVETLARRHDLVLIDTAPHAETEARIAIRASRLVLIPIQPTPMDLWATAPTITLAQEEKARVLLVLNRVPPRSLLTEQMRQQIMALQVELAGTSLGNRTAYASSLAYGMGVTETVTRKTAAAKEIAALATEIEARLAPAPGA